MPFRMNGAYFIHREPKKERKEKKKNVCNMVKGEIQQGMTTFGLNIYR